jgi:hypothetical protein
MRAIEAMCGVESMGRRRGRYPSLNMQPTVRVTSSAVKKFGVTRSVKTASAASDGPAIQLMGVRFRA